MKAGRVELFVNVIWRELDMAVSQQQPAEHGLAAALDDIFGNDAWRTIDGEPDERIDRVMHLLAESIGARWPTYFRMVAGGKATRYVLLHLTNHDAGRDLMKECMWRVASGVGFEVRQCDDPKQPLLITPEPDLTPLREWVLERLRRSPDRSRTKDELKNALRQEPWLSRHLNKVLRGLREEGATDESSGMISLTARPRLPFV